MSSPRTWGCFFELIHKVIRDCVFPTHVGVFLIFFLSVALRKSLPHARGGVSRNHGGKSDNAQSSPRTWGCFPKPRSVRLPRRVFPTHVGVFLSLYLYTDSTLCLPHARGGVSIQSVAYMPPSSSSPRTWGCFYCPNFRIRRICSLPHARGGVSLHSGDWRCPRTSSPRTWGCFSSWYL